METKDGKQAIYAETRQDWRNWLTKNSQKEKSVWLILYYKKSKTRSVNLVEATEEALCLAGLTASANRFFF